MFDFQASLAVKRVDPTANPAHDLVGQLESECLAWAARDAKAARDRYQRRAPQPTLSLPAELRVGEPPQHLLAGWLAIQLDFELKAPWYSKDYRPLHVLDNPVRKDRVFGVPFMAAASWKGLLRWSCRMEHGLLDHLASHDGKLDGWSDAPWIVHLFGNAKGEGEEFSLSVMAYGSPSSSGCPASPRNFWPSRSEAAVKAAPAPSDEGARAALTAEGRAEATSA